MRKNLLAILAMGITALSINAQELLTDNGFANDGALVGRTSNEWGMWSGNGATVEVIDGVCTATPIQSVNNWDCQVEQWEFLVENDSTYTVKFKAWSDADRNISLTIEDPANGYNLLGVTPDADGEVDPNGGDNKSKWTIAITTKPTVYTRTVTIKNVVDNTSFKFAFLLAETSDVVYLDDVSLMSKSATKPSTSVSNITKQGFSVYPNPAKSVITVNGNNGNEINIFDLAGKLVLKSNVSKIDISTIQSGIYVVKSGSYTQKLLVK